MEPVELLNRVNALAKRGLTQQQIAQELGFKTTATLSNHLVRASQATKKPVPVFGQGSGRNAPKRVEILQVRRRGNRDSFGVNVPMEPMMRAGFKVGQKLSVRATRGRIVLRG